MPGDLTTFIPRQISVDASGIVLAGKLGASIVLILEDPSAIPAEAHYTTFAIDTYAGDPSVHPISLWRRLTSEQLRQLRIALASQEDNLAAGISPALLDIFMHKLDAELATEPSARFRAARFGTITRDPSGAIVGQFSMGVDVVGIIHDHRGISVEQHVVPLPPTHFSRLAKDDRLSLAAAIHALSDTVPGVDPLWRQVAHDASR